MSGQKRKCGILKRVEARKKKSVKKALSCIQQAFEALKILEMDSQDIHTAMAQLAVAERNVENHAIYILNDDRWMRRRRAEQQQREGELITMFPFSRYERVSVDDEEAIEVESEVVPMS